MSMALWMARLSHWPGLEVIMGRSLRESLSFDERYLLFVYDRNTDVLFW